MTDLHKIGDNVDYSKLGAASQGTKAAKFSTERHVRRYMDNMVAKAGNEINPIL